MKKTILTVLLCGVMVLGMTGCGKQKNEFDIGNKSDIKISQNDVIMTIKEGTLTNKSATLVLTNYSDKNFIIKRNGKKIETKKTESAKEDFHEYCNEIMADITIDNFADQLEFLDEVYKECISQFAE